MNQLLKEAFDRAAGLPPEEQDRFAKFLLAELDADREWDQLLALPESDQLLDRLANQALSEHRAGRTRPPASHRLVGMRSFPTARDGTAGART